VAGFVTDAEPEAVRSRAAQTARRARIGSMVTWSYRGASSPRLRTHPLNLIRVMPAKGGE